MFCDPGPFCDFVWTDLQNVLVMNGTSWAVETDADGRMLPPPIPAGWTLVAGEGTVAGKVVRRFPRATKIAPATFVSAAQRRMCREARSRRVTGGSRGSPDGHREKPRLKPDDDEEPPKPRLLDRYAH